VWRKVTTVHSIAVNELMVETQQAGPVPNAAGRERRQRTGGDQGLYFVPHIL